jgi:predicted nucleotidyltransferase
MVNHLTPYPEIDLLLDQLCGQMQTVLGSCLVGLYLHGSLACGDFNPQTSDIDFLVVTDGPLSIEVFHTLKEMHARLFESRLAWSQKLEGAYIPREDLGRYDPSHAPIPWLGVDGHFALERLGSDWILQRWSLREKGIVVSGPALHDMIDPVSSDDLREAVLTSLREWWSPPFPSPDRFLSSEYQAYAVLTMCRSSYVLENGCVASKPQAARWAMETLEDQWHALIASAEAWRPGVLFDRFDDVVRFILYTLGHWGLIPSKQL